MTDGLSVQVIPLALVVALSPLSIIPAVLVLHSPRPRLTGPAFLAGWVFGLVALTALFIGVSGLLGELDGDPPPWASWARVGIGVTLIVFGVFRWLTRHNQPHQIPGTRHITEAGPGKALALGALLTVANPKVLFVCAAAGLAIGTSTLGAAGRGFAVAYFVVLAASTTALPVLAHLLAAKRFDRSLERLRRWIQLRQNEISAVALIVIGLVLMASGFGGR